jgi:hypothetical protein
MGSLLLSIRNFRNLLVISTDGASRVRIACRTALRAEEAFLSKRFHDYVKKAVVKIGDAAAACDLTCDAPSLAAHRLTSA